MKTAWPLWAEYAFRELLHGVREEAGELHNARILEYFRSTSLSPTDGDETSWCAAGINHVLRMACILGTNAANARSFVEWGEHCSPWRRGAITVLWREDPKSWKGHVGILTGWDAQFVYLLGGNQGNTWSVRPYPKLKVLAQRWPGRELVYA
jgi:uncharacterized protein (TIGR02594 family)